MLIDTHSHLNFNAYKTDADEVIRRSLRNNIWMINVGSQFKTSQRAVEIAEKYPKGVYAAIGLHPIHLSSGIFKTKIDKQEIAFQTREEEFNYEKYKELAKSPKVAAIGEIGLDYYYRPKTKMNYLAAERRGIPAGEFFRQMYPRRGAARYLCSEIKLEQFKEKQKEVFLKQLELAEELKLPVILHCRVAHDDLIEILAQLQDSNKFTMVKRLPKGVVHCFTGTWEQARKYLEMGFYIGFNGIIFKLDLDEIIKKTPIEKILIETDCPYLTPLPMVGRNEPLYVKYIAEKIAKIRKISYEKIANVTTRNAKELFRL